MDFIPGHFATDIAFIETRLRGVMVNDEPRLQLLQDAVEYTLFSGGKRLRPLFCFMVGELFGVPRERLGSLSCALEMIHSASLIMDDLPHMDDAETRRGKPANHRVFGQDIASLACIALLTKAYNVILGDNGLPERKRIEIVNRLLNTVGMEGMVGGQFVDLTSEESEMDIATLEYRHRHKTATLFVASGATAALIGNAAKEELQAVVDFAENLGLAYQIKDDLLDVEGNPVAVGKSLKTDKSNFVSIYGIDESRRLLGEYTGNAVEAIRIFEGKNEKLLQLAHILMQRQF